MQLFCRTYYPANNKEYIAFQTRRKYFLGRLVKKVPVFDGLKYYVFFISAQRVFAWR